MNTTETTTDSGITRVACLGEVMIELVTRDARTAQIGVAGDTYNTAVYLKRVLSGQASPERAIGVSYITALGDDPMSERIVDHMHAHHIETDCVERRAGRTPGLYAIDTDTVGERSFSYWRDSAAARTLFQTPAQVELQVLDRFDLVYLSGISLAILPGDMRTHLLDGLSRFRAQGGVVAFDSNYRPRLWESRAVAQQITEAMWSATDLALPSVDDEMALFGDHSEADVVKRLRRGGVIAGALKRGESGPLDLGSEGEASETGEFARVDHVVDTTAAGDSFNAGWLAAYVRGLATPKCLGCGHTLASQVVQQHGAIVDTRPVAVC